MASVVGGRGQRLFEHEQIRRFIVSEQALSRQFNFDQILFEEDELKRIRFETEAMPLDIPLLSDEENSDFSSELHLDRNLKGAVSSGFGIKKTMDLHS